MHSRGGTKAAFFATNFRLFFAQFGWQTLLIFERSEIRKLIELGVKLELLNLASGLYFFGCNG